MHCRTKLKQTEVDCEFLKIRCESLSNENRRLKTELRYGRNVDSCPRALMTTTCQSCQKRNVSSSGTSSSGGQPYDKQQQQQ
ncbi:unnamed protein product [Linum trigynum]|uniref:Leucine zipper homeobox-associated domain-containing protein n=1 Tax=Linum trigynum TaxID=586398 RepID=A0AAV2GTA6_9ROSI